MLATQNNNVYIVAIVNYKAYYTKLHITLHKIVIVLHFATLHYVPLFDSYHSYIYR